jgi:hypothetical protein
MSLIPLFKRLPQYAFRHFYIAIIRGIDEVLRRPVFLKFIRAVKTVYKMLQYSLLPLYVQLYHSSIIKIVKIVVE